MTKSKIVSFHVHRYSQYCTWQYYYSVTSLCVMQYSQQYFSLITCINLLHIYVYVLFIYLNVYIAKLFVSHNIIAI